MEEFFYILKKCTLFKNIASGELSKILNSMNAYVQHYAKNERIRFAGSEIRETGIIVNGIAQITKTDINGNHNIIIELKESQSFGEMIAFAEIKKSPVDIVAATDCSVIFIPVRKIIDICSSAGEYSAILIKNTVKFMAEKSMMLHIKNDILAQKNIRGKLLSYFYYETDPMKNNRFKIPFTREGLADFLCVNVSALSRELGKMRDEGILTFRKNSFVINNKLTDSD